MKNLSVLRTAIYTLLLTGCISCASIMNQPYTTISLYSSKPARVNIENQEYTVIKKLKVKVNRSSAPLKVTAKQDSVQNEFTLLPKNSFNYYANVLNYGIGFIADAKSEKRYTYQKYLYLNMDPEARSRFAPHRKGEAELQFSIPYINSFFLQPPHEPDKANTGFWGISAGLEYFYQNNKSMGFFAAAASDFFVPVPAAIDISGEYELMGTCYFSITDNFKIRNFSIGYGINYSRNNWELRYYDRFNPPPPSREPVKKKTCSAGLTINTYYRVGEHFHMGVIYRPTFIRLKPVTQPVYEHLISLDFAWKWKL